VEIANGTVPSGTDVYLHNVVVTGLNYNRKYMWVKDAGGAAPYNGIYVYRGPNNANTPALAEGIVIGAVVDLSGRAGEFNGMKQITGGPTIELVSAGDAPEALEGVDWRELADYDTSAPYRNVLVTIENVAVTSTSEADDSFFVGDQDAELQVATFASALPEAEPGQCYASITGIVSRFQDQMQILPRTLDDLILATDPGDCD
jgi:hypothetical protein